MTTERLQVADNPDQSRFELRDGDAVLGWVDYRPAGPSLIFAHTEVDPAHAGEGLGSVLVRGALEHLRAGGRTVIPLCPFTAAFLDRHPDFSGVVDPSFRR
jgi:predicted GNAT family acetyltransferase